MRLLASVAVVFCLTGSLRAQVYERQPCPRGANQGLKKALHRRAAFSVVELDLGDDLAALHSQRMASSIRRAEGRPPANAKCDPCEPGSSKERAAIEYDLWTCMYAPSKAADGKLATAWSEGAPGPGIGEVLVSQVNPTKPIRIWAGFGKSREHYLWNNRPKRMRVYLLGVGGFSGAGASVLLMNIRALSHVDITLEDRFGWQTIRPAWKWPTKTFERYLVAFEILSVYPGTRFDDTLISEVSTQP